MKELAFIALGLGAALVTGSRANGGVMRSTIQGSGTVATESRSMPAFSGIALSGIYEVSLTCGKEQKVVVSADDNVLPHVKTDVKNKMLTISMDVGVMTRNTIHIEVSVPDIETVLLDGAGEIEVAGVDNQALRIGVDGTASARVQGRTKRFQAEVGGTSEMDAKALKAAKASVRVTGTSTAAISVQDELEASVAEISTLLYRGNPQKVRTNIDEMATFEKW